MGNQLIATSHTGKIGVWNAVTKHWQVGEEPPHPIVGEGVMGGGEGGGFTCSAPL